MVLSNKYEEPLRRSARTKKPKIDKDYVTISSDETDSETSKDRSDTRIRVGKKMNSGVVREKTKPTNYEYKQNDFVKYPLFYVSTQRADTFLICEVFSLDNTGQLLEEKVSCKYFDISNYRSHVPNPDMKFKINSNISDLRNMLKII